MVVRIGSIRKRVGPTLVQRACSWTWLVIAAQPNKGGYAPIQGAVRISYGSLTCRFRAEPTRLTSLHACLWTPYYQMWKGDLTGGGH